MVMMGEPLGRQDRLFYEFDLEDVVPADHLPRRVDAVLDLSWLARRDAAPTHRRIGSHAIRTRRRASTRVP
jgi:hypothetical protein